MKKKINVLIFANDEKVERKAIKIIDNLPCLVRIINSFRDLSNEYSFRFIVFCYYEEIEMIEDEMSRWISDVTYLSTDTRNMKSSIFHNFIHSNFYQRTGLFYITSLHFPLIDSIMIKNFIDSFNDRPLLMFGEMNDDRISFWKKFFPAIEKKKEENSVFINWNMNHSEKFLFQCILDEQVFKDLYNIPFPTNLLYYHCISWSIFRLPSYFFKYEAIPFIEENDLKYIESSCVRKRNMELNLYLQKLWTKWKNIEERIARLEK
jgi:hypothetical protein